MGACQSCQSGPTAEETEAQERQLAEEAARKAEQATREAAERAEREAEEQAAREAEQAAREAEQAAREAEQRRRDAMAPINVTVLRVDAEATEIAVKQWQNVRQSVLEGLQLDRDEWAVREVRCGEEMLKADATWESEGV